MSFMAFPPEVNSGMVYAGPGPGSLTAAAAAWNGLASDLNSAATSVQSAVSELTSSWQGPSSSMLVSAVSPYTAWLESTGAQAAQVGAQANTAAGLFESAYAGTVPPPVIVANRSLLMALIATNFFGQNTPAIMATEAHYEEMWAQDGATLDGYHAATQANTAALHAQQPTPPPLVSKDFGQSQIGSLAAQGQSAAQQGLASANPAMSDGSLLGSNPLSSMSSLLGPGLGSGTGGATSAMQEIYYPAMLASIPARVLPSLLMQLARMGSLGSLGSAGSAASHGAAAGTGALMTQIGNFVDGKLSGVVGTLVGHFNTAASSMSQAVSAKLAQAASMGALKVPQAWALAADGMSRAAPVLPTTTVAAPVQSAPMQMMGSGGMPGGAFSHAMMGALAGRGMGAVAAKAPKVIPRSPAGG